VLEQLSNDGLDIDIEGAVQTVSDLRVGDDRDPHNVTQSAMRSLKRKDGSPMSFVGLQVIRKRHWPPELQATQTVAEAALHKKIRSQGGSVVTNDIIAKINLSPPSTAVRPAEALPLPPPPPPPPREQSANGDTQKSQVQRSDDADLRASDPPCDPEVCELSLEYLVQEPRSPDGCSIYKFVPASWGPVRLNRWSWWKALADIGIFVLH
jgi:hypothetical protein